MTVFFVSCKCNFIFEIISPALFVLYIWDTFIRLEGKPLWEMEQCHVSINCIGFPRLSQIILSKLEAGLHLEKFLSLPRTIERASFETGAKSKEGLTRSQTKEKPYIISVVRTLTVKHRYSRFSSAKLRNNSFVKLHMQVNWQLYTFILLKRR